MAGRKPLNLFYRIETAKNEGPYRGSRITMSAFTARHGLCNRPPPGNDQSLWKHWDRSDSRDYKFGFKTESQLRRWFTLAVLKRMQREAEHRGKIFFVSIYRGKCIAGKWQAMARLNRLELVSRTELAKYVAGEKLIKKGIAAPVKREPCFPKGGTTNGI